jgi:tRNA pseudouridine55 synthase
MDLDKTYTATARFGAVSDTLDADGEITNLDTPLPSEDDIRAALPKLSGDLLQIPPMASALKHEGARLYDLHRRGISVEREPRPVTVHAFTLNGFDPVQHSATFDVSCSSGTYVRTLISDLAACLGSGAYLSALRRASVGHLDANDALPPQDLSPAKLVNRIIPPEQLLVHLPGVDVPNEVVREMVCHGGRIEGRGIAGSYRVMCGGELLAVYRDEVDQGKAEVVLCAE